MAEQKQSKGKVVLGLILLFGGILALINKMNIPIPEWVSDLLTWELILIVLGLNQIIKKEYTSGIILLIIGSYFKFMEWTDWRDFFWPIVAIAAGLIILLNNSKNKRQAKQQEGTDRLDLVSLFGSGSKIVSSFNFKGGDVVSIFGGSEVDFTDSRLSDNGAVLEVISIFGGTTIVVPPHWNVDITASSIFGGFKDSREGINTNNGSNEPKLIIKGVSIFGGGEIKTS